MSDPDSLTAETSRMATASLLMGVIGLCSPLLALIGIPLPLILFGVLLGPVGLIPGIIALLSPVKRGRTRFTAIAGIITSILCIIVIITVTWTIRRALANIG